MEKLLPQLRFPEFKGEWEEKKLINLSSDGFSNGAFNDPKKVGSGYRIINVKDMYVDGTINVNSLLRVNLDEKEFSKNRVEFGDIFFTRSSLVKEGIAHSNVNLNYIDDLTYDGHLIRMRPIMNVSLPIFLYYNFTTDKVREQFVKRGKTTTMTTIGQDDIASVAIILPKLPEQTKIATFLTAVDEKLTALKQKKTLLEQYKKGVMQQIFSQELRFKDDNGNDFPDWKEKMLGDFCTFFSGGTPTSTNQKYYTGTIPFIGSGNIYDTEVYNFISDEALKSSSAKIVQKGDLLYALYGANSGELAISKMNGAINQAILCIRNEECITYLYYVLLLNKDIIVATYLQGGQGNLSAQIIKRLNYKFPSIPEQTKIANFLSAIDEKINHCQDQIEKAEIWKKGLLQQMFV